MTKNTPKVFRAKRTYAFNKVEASKFISCPKCNKQLPLIGKRQPDHILRGHLGHCDGLRLNENLNCTDSQQIFEPQQSVIDAPKFKPCEHQIWFQYQLQILESYSDANFTKINKAAKQEKPAKISDTLSIYEFALKNNLTNQGINDLLKLFQEIQTSNGTNIPLPNNHVTLKRQCCSSIISNPETDTSTRQ